MEIEAIVDFWKKQTEPIEGKWVHPEDAGVLLNSPHSFNLDFPAGAFVGDILRAPVIILAANGGYDPKMTPQEFAGETAKSDYLERIVSPSPADWNSVSPYYHKVNYGKYLFDGRVALVNACAYRSPKISREEEADNRKILKRLRSVKFARDWLLECMLPLAKSGRRLVVAKRYGLWRLPQTAWQVSGVTKDPYPVSPDITGDAWKKVENFIENLGKEEFERSIGIADRIMSRDRIAMRELAK